MAQNVKPSAQRPKKRAVISYDNMSPELQAAFKEKYPRGYADYMGDIFKVDKPDGTFFYAVEVDIPDAVYLVVDDTVVPEIEGDVFPGEAEEMQEDDDRLDD